MEIHDDRISLYENENGISHFLYDNDYPQDSIPEVELIEDDQVKLVAQEPKGESEMSKFKAGDIVVCVEQVGRLVLGAKYEIEDECTNYENKTGFKVKGIDQLYLPSRFELVKKDADKDIIKAVYFNEEKKTTVVLFEDGTRSIVKTAPDTEFDEYQGFVAAIAKKVLGSSSNVRKTLDRKNKTKYPLVLEPMPIEDRVFEKVVGLEQ